MQTHALFCAGKAKLDSRMAESWQLLSIGLSDYEQIPQGGETLYMICYEARIVQRNNFYGTDVDGCFAVVINKTSPGKARRR